MCTTHTYIKNIIKTAKSTSLQKHIFIISVIENLHFRKKYVEKNKIEQKLKLNNIIQQ